MEILITGGAGFIGSHLADRLVEKDYITGINNINFHVIESFLKYKTN